ncbi:hypothetical protein GGQ54_002597 [Naumannella cuiyingiana]|uniref:Transmembrane protein n=1 Tax=Naumannella cuiyingiana TaxID=1347891 RepID=A0A7Z0ILZ7_9ACTN|nr:hypothetical protein [Naumannella cuiyingiana]NYI72037.1 hypothetical protein [Naumannella cuiyingiana]
MTVNHVDPMNPIRSMRSAFERLTDKLTPTLNPEISSRLIEQSDAGQQVLDAAARGHRRHIHVSALSALLAGPIFGAAFANVASIGTTSRSVAVAGAIVQGGTILILLAAIAFLVTTRDRARGAYLAALGVVAFALLNKFIRTPDQRRYRAACNAIITYGRQVYRSARTPLLCHELRRADADNAKDAARAVLSIGAAVGNCADQNARDELSARLAQTIGHANAQQWRNVRELRVADATFQDPRIWSVSVAGIGAAISSALGAGFVVPLIKLFIQGR